MIDDRAERIERITRLLTEAAAVACMVISIDGRVGEEDAGTLLGLASGSLRNMRRMGMGPTAYRRAVNGAKVSYAIADLAIWIEDGREDFLA